MNNKDFLSALSLREGLPLSDTRLLIQHLIGEMTSQLGEENVVTIQNFGTFEVKKRMERVVVNPGTGQRMLVPPRLALTFRASSSLKSEGKKGGAL
ncbi:MAG: HU family DNA-binding protein [Bacteroidaceae bacterium]|nr:HU family DNA-binding protein [Bacteroidaceae bacterium]